VTGLPPDQTPVAFVNLAQNSTNGLFAGASTGTLPTTIGGHPGSTLCKTGNLFEVRDGDGVQNLSYSWALT
jgi:hypothetical protein